MIVCASQHHALTLLLVLCAESPWVSQRGDLPAQQYLWPAPPAGADPGTPAQGKCRKVRSTQHLHACSAAAHAAHFQHTTLWQSTPTEERRTLFTLYRSQLPLACTLLCFAMRDAHMHPIAASMVKGC
jgi:hypothetical protein